MRFVHVIVTLAWKERCERRCCNRETSFRKFAAVAAMNVCSVSVQPVGESCGVQ